MEDEDGNVLEECLVSTLQPGNSLVAAGYCLYSSSIFFCLTLGCGVNIFTLDRQIGAQICIDSSVEKKKKKKYTTLKFDVISGEFVLTHADVKIPKRGKIVSFNEANRHEWDVPLQEYVTAVQHGEGESGGD